MGVIWVSEYRASNTETAHVYLEDRSWWAYRGHDTRGQVGEDGEARTHRRHALGRRIQLHRSDTGQSNMPTRWIGC